MEIVGFAAICGWGAIGISKLFGYNGFNGLIIIPQGIEDRVILIYNNPISRFGFYSYLFITLVSFTNSTYNDGKLALLNHRVINNEVDKEFAVTWKGCRRNMGDNFLDSIFFPWNMISNIFPYIILFMNPRNEVKKQD